jgi:DNA-binding LytR/AlgR family response regulator
MFDAAFVDMNLGGDKSHAVADALAARGVPFVFATGYSGQAMRDADRARPVLRKPFQHEKLAEILTRLLTQSPSDNGSSGNRP